VGEGDVLRLPYPSYILYRTLAELQGAQFEEVEYRGDWSLPGKFAAGGDRLKLVYLPNPNSPTGTFVSPEDVLELARLLPCPVLVDEAYADYAESNCVSLVSECDKIMVSRSLSKSYALAGLRFGYLVAQPHMIEQFVKVKDSYNCDALSVAGAMAALSDQAWLQENRSKIIATRTRLVRELRNLGFIGPNTEANFAWCLHSRRSVRPIYEELKERKILVRYMVYPRWSDGLRITVGTDAEIDAFLSAVRELV
jgi:histidinol-phosphate aminotransferase